MTEATKTTQAPNAALKAARQAARIAALEESLTVTLARLQAIEGSTSWRASAALRTALAKHPWLKSALRRGLRLAWRLSRLRRGQPALPQPPSPARRGAAARENILLVVHETSRTGAPILGWNIANILSETYDVFTVRLGDGPLTAEFDSISTAVLGPFHGIDSPPEVLERGLAAWFAGNVFKYAIVNGILSRGMLEVCARHHIPSLLLVHEFGAYIWPYKSLRQALVTATEVVFPARLVARSSLDLFPDLADLPFHVAPQGMSLVPGEAAAPKPPPAEALARISGLRAQGAFIVIGAGSVEYRKGVDLFIAAAAAMRRREPGRRVQFLWIGAGYRPEEDMRYSVYLREQINRCGLGEHVTMFDDVSDLEPIYALADAFFLASRLDPLPNVSIDAAHRGIPLICFAEASGTAELLAGAPALAAFAVPYLDSHAAAEVIGRLVADEDWRQQAARATKEFAERTFDMRRYVRQLDEIGTRAAAAMESEVSDVRA